MSPSKCPAVRLWSRHIFQKSILYTKMRKPLHRPRLFVTGISLCDVCVSKNKMDKYLKDKKMGTLAGLVVFLLSIQRVHELYVLYNRRSLKKKRRGPVHGFSMCHLDESPLVCYTLTQSSSIRNIYTHTGHHFFFGGKVWSLSFFSYGQQLATKSRRDKESSRHCIASPDKDGRQLVDWSVLHYVNYIQQNGLLNASTFFI